MDEITAILNSARPVDNIINDLKRKSVCVPSWEFLIKAYEPSFHEIAKDTITRKDKIRKDGTKEEASRIYIGLEKLLTKRMTEFMFAIPVKRIYHNTEGFEVRHQQAVEYGILLALECAEEVVQVVHKYRIAGEQPAVGIEGGGFLVEVSGAYIGVAGQFVPLLVAAQHERHFGMHFQSGQAEQDVDAGGFHHLGGCQVVLFIETCFQFYEDGHFLAVLCGGYQGVDDGGVFGNAVLGHHDLADGRLVHCFVQEMDEVFERVEIGRASCRERV